MTEREGCAILKRRFEAAGLAIVEDHRLAVGEKTIRLDGYDPSRRVGYEYLTTEQGDRADLTPDVIAELERWMRAGDAALLLVDEIEGLDEPALEDVADRFLAAARQRGML